MGRNKLVFDCLMCFSAANRKSFWGKGRRRKKKYRERTCVFWPFLDKRTCVFIDVSGPVTDVLADLLGQSVDNLKRQRGDIENKESRQSKLILTFFEVS